MLMIIKLDTSLDAFIFQGLRIVEGPRSLLNWFITFKMEIYLIFLRNRKEISAAIAMSKCHLIIYLFRL
jgi:hypothetical protein